MKRSNFLKSVLLILVCVAFSYQPLFPAIEYINNGTIKLGINNQWGGGIGYFSHMVDVKNVINRRDTGRNIQQSFYGDYNGFWYNNEEWRYNPVQGGDLHGNGSIINSKVNWGDAIYVKTNPKDWARNNVSTGDVMEQWITLRGDVAQIVYRYKYKGSGESTSQNQEMPAPYFVSDLSTLAYYSGGLKYKYSSQIPVNNGDGTGSNGNLTTGEYWAAYVNTAPGKWGCGVLTPGTNYIEYFKSTGSGGVTGFATSYFGPIRNLKLVDDFDIQYTAYLKIGNVVDIRNRFNNIRSNGMQIAHNGSFETPSGSNPDKWTPATDSGGSHTYHTSGGSNVYDGSDSVALTAQSSGPWELPYFKQTQNGVTGSTWYKFKFRAKCESLYNGTAGIRVIQFNKYGNFLSDSGIISASELSGNHSSFQYRTFNFKTHGSAFIIEIRLQLNSLDSWARVWFDAVSFTLKNP
jgi:hypothetical protein